jgi:hypothetical protein
VDDFIKEIKKESQLAIPKDYAITLYQLKDGQEVEIKPTYTIKSIQKVLFQKIHW